MTYIPQIPSQNDPQFSRKIGDEFRRIFQYFYELNNQVKNHDEQIQQAIQPVIQPQSQALPISIQPSYSPSSIIDPQPFNVQSKLGIAAQAQIAGIPSYSALPATSQIGVDPLLQDTAMFRVGDQLYVVDQTTRTFVVIAVSASPQIIRARQTNITAVSVNANSTADQDLMSLTFAAGDLNTLTKLCHLYAFGTLDEDSGPTIVFKLKIGSTAIITLTPNTPGTTKTGLGWGFQALLTTSAIGASGNFEAH